MSTKRGRKSKVISSSCHVSHSMVDVLMENEAAIPCLDPKKQQALFEARLLGSKETENGRLINIEIAFLNCREDVKQTVKRDKRGSDPKDVPEKKIQALLEKGLELKFEDFSQRVITSAAASTSTSLHYQSKDVHVFQGTIFLKRSDLNLLRSKFSSFITKCERSEFYLKVGLNCELLTEPDITINQKVKLDGFSFGTLVDLVHLNTHFRSDSVSKDGLKKIAKNASSHDLRANFKHGNNRLYLEFRTTTGYNKRTKSIETIRYQFLVKYGSIHHIVLTPTKEHLAVHLVLSHPPLLYIYKQDDGHEVKSSKRDIHVDDTRASDSWYRVKEVPDMMSSVTIGKCNVLRLDIPLVINKKDTSSSGVIDPWDLVSCLKCYVDVPNYLAPIEETPLENCATLETKVQVALKGVPFKVAYAVLCVLSPTFQVEDELRFNKQLGKFWKTIINLLKLDPGPNESQDTVRRADIVEEVFYDIYRALERGSFIRIFESLETGFRDRMAKGQDTLKMEEEDACDCEGVQKMRRIILTPTRQLYLPPEPFLLSRFLRESNPDFAMRLTLREDDHQLLSFTVCKGPDEMQKKFLAESIKGPIMEGLTISDRIYEFLGSSSSQLREHGMMLYAKDEKGLDAATIRERIGDLSLIKNEGKYIARLGLAFSQALATLTVLTECVSYIEDIKGAPHPETCQCKGKNEYTFTDGIGKISESLAEKARVALNRSQPGPSAFQIRYGGSKGMVVIDPTLGPGDQLLIRNPSMKKYSSDSTSLELLNYSSPRAVFLNRPLITLLDQLNVNKRIFLEMQMKTLHLLTNAFLSECEAISVIKNYSTINSMVPLNHLVNAGINLLNEPFFRKALDALVHKVVYDLKMKGRIKIPMDAGRMMYGVVDETDSLEEGEVFVQYSNEEDLKDRKVIVGKVLVTKFPCMVPGDVRKFKVKDVKALHHICDCIVFPAKGSRPHPDEMAGSDLDGDEYAVIWYKPLLFEGDNRKAMDFPDVPEKKLDHNVEVEDLLNFYMEYIKSNSVGLIASAHIAHADKNGIDIRVCNELALKYSYALDFAKTGTNRPMTSMERPFSYPDFMEKYSDKPTYLSKRALGFLYRQVSMYELCVTEEAVVNIDCESNPLLEHVKWKEYEKSAVKAYHKYQGLIQSLIKQFGVDDEASLLTSAFIKSTKAHGSERRQMKDAEEMAEYLVKNVFKKMRRFFEEEFELMEGNAPDVMEKKLAKASAWYLVSFRLSCQEEYPVHALPWLVADQLALLAKSKRPPGSTPGSFMKLSFREAIDLIDKRLDTEVNEEPNIASRIEKAQEVLFLWLDSQKHLLLGHHNSRKTLTDRINNVLHKIFLAFIMNPINAKLPSVGTLVMVNFRELIKRLFKSDQMKSVEPEEHFKIYKYMDPLGLSALIALNRFFRTRRCEGILVSKATASGESLPLFVNTFHLHMPKHEAAQKLRKSITQNKPQFIQTLGEMSGVDKIEGDFTEKGYNDWYLHVTARGTKWNLLSLRNNIVHSPVLWDIAKKLDKLY